MHNLLDSDPCSLGAHKAHVFEAAIERLRELLRSRQNMTAVAGLATSNRSSGSSQDWWFRTRPSSTTPRKSIASSWMRATAEVIAVIHITSSNILSSPFAASSIFPHPRAVAGTQIARLRPQQLGQTQNRVQGRAQLVTQA